MVLPITGPTNVNTSTPTLRVPGDHWTYKARYKQARPYTIPLPYSMRHSVIVSGVGGSLPAPALANWWFITTLDVTNSPLYSIPYPGQTGHADFQNERNLILNRTREKFFSKANERVNLAVDILQRRQAYDMIVKRAGQLARVAGALRRGNLQGAWWNLRNALTERLGTPLSGGLVKEPLKHLGKKGREALPEWRSGLRNAGSWWLEYSYGWKPLVQDIFEAASVLSSPIDDLWIHASSKRPFSEVVAANNRSAFDDWTDERNVWELELFARVGGVVSCDNPNLQSLKNAGLTNPLAWAWELIPYSFVVDWLWNVGDFIESLDDTVGLTIKDGYYSYGWRGTSLISRTLVKAFSATWRKYEGQTASKLRAVAGFDRSRGIPTVKLAKRRKILTSVDRGLNAASLLAQALPKRSAKVGL